MPSSPDAPRPRLLAVGAIERDNFGDLLYVHLLEHYAAQSHDISLGAPVLPTVELPLDREVRLWPDELDRESFDVAWTVGGEVGGTPPEYAYLTAHGTSAHRAMMKASDLERDEILAAAMGGTIIDPPYLPRPALSARSTGARLVLNSIGLSGIPREPLWRRPSLEAALREASFIGVRDRASSAALDDLGIAHRLAPDAAHVVARVRPVDRQSDGPLLVHLSRQAFEKVTPEEWAESLHEAFRSVPGEIRLFLAGLAPAHDSLSRAKDLRDRLARLVGTGRAVTVSETRSVWDRVEEIAGARAWIGGSLHGRIIASAYGVPRVSLAKPKVDAYARDWDPEQPYGVGPRTLAESVARALATPTPPRDDLATAADANYRAALASLSAPVPDDLEQARRRAHREELERLRTHARRLDRRLAARTTEVDRLRGEARPGAGHD